MRVLAALLVVAALLSGCADKLSFNSATLDEPSFDLEPLTGDAKTQFHADAGALGKYNVSWDWGDGTVSYGASASHAYGFTNGIMTVRLVATDEAGKTGIATQQVVLGTGKNANPTASISLYQRWIEAGKPVDLSAYVRDADGDPIRYLWTLDDAVVARESAGQLVVNATGNHTLKLRVSDPKGGSASADAQLLVVKHIPPSVINEVHNGTLRAGDAGAGVSQKLWIAPSQVPDTDVDAVRYNYTLKYPGYTLVLLKWNDTTGQGVVDLDLELQYANNGTVIFSQQTRPPAAPFEFNVTLQQPGSYVAVVRGVVGANVDYSLLIHSSLFLTPEAVAAAEG